MNIPQGACLWGFYLAACVLGLPTVARSESDTATRRFESTQTEMGVPFKVILYAPDEATANRAFQAAFSRVAELNRVLSRLRPR